MGCDAASGSAGLCMKGGVGALDPAWVLLALVAIVALSVGLFFLPLKRVGLIRWSIGWVLIAIAAALSLSEGWFSATVTVSLATSCGVLGLCYFYSSFEPITSPMLELRLLSLLGLVVFAVSELLLGFVGRSGMNLGALMVIGFSTLGIGAYCVKSWLDSDNTVYAVMVLVFSVIGGALLADSLARREGSDYWGFLGVNHTHAPSDWVLLLVFWGCFIATLARLSLEFQMIHRAHLSALEQQDHLTSAEDFRASMNHLEEARSISMLSATIAHELNQPLTAISTNVQVLQRYQNEATVGGELVAGFLLDIESDIKRTEDLLSHYLSGGIDDEILNSTCDLCEVLNNSLARFKGVFSSKGIQYLVQVPSETILVKFNPVHLSQVLTNLLRNSIEALSDSENTVTPKIEILVSVLQDKVQVSISDNGPGVNSETLRKLETMFQSEKPRGMGLGLVISRWLIDRYSGSLYLWSDSGRGFFVQISLLEV